MDKKELKFVLDTGVLCPILILIACDRDKGNLISVKYFIEEETFEKEMKKHLNNKDEIINDSLMFRFGISSFLEFLNELIENKFFEIASLNKEMEILDLISKNNLIYNELKNIYEKNKELFKFSGRDNNVGEFRSYLLAILINADYFTTFDYKCCNTILEKFKVRRGISKKSRGAVFPWRVGIIGLCDYLCIVCNNNENLFESLETLINYFEDLIDIDNNHPEILLIKELYKEYGKSLID